MDDMTAFENQLATRLEHMAGPEPTVDAMASVRTATTTSPKWRFQSMFSATKFVVAGVIVALFGGFLLVSQPFEQQGEGVPGAATGGPGTFNPAGSLSVPRTFHTATLLPDGRVLVVGGTGRPTDDGEAQATVEVWDPATASFSRVARAGERRHHTATLLPDGPLSSREGTVLVVGGHGGGQDEVEHLWLPHPEPGGGVTWGKGGPATEGGRGEHTATLLPDGRVLVVGGVGESDESLASAEVWDQEQEPRWSLVGSLNEARREHTATLLTDGRVLVVGGATDLDESLASAEVWDSVTETFSPAGSLGSPRESHTATLLPDGRVIVVGGRLQGSSVPSAEVWDPVTETFSPAGSLSDARAFHTATLLPDGRVLIVGGHVFGAPDQGAVASTEVFDPTTASFGPGTSLIEAREAHTATLLTDGRVLIIGGHNSNDLVATAEVWEPSDR